MASSIVDPLLADAFIAVRCHYDGRPFYILTLESAYSFRWPSIFLS